MTLILILRSCCRDGTLGQSFSISVSRVIKLTPEHNLGLQVSGHASQALDDFCLWQEKQFPSTFQDEAGIANSTSPKINKRHDLAILLTKRELCRSEEQYTSDEKESDGRIAKKKESCSTLGLAELGSICKKGKSCTINQDNGLTVAHTIAHEIAHTLGIPHDDPDDPNCVEISGHFVMSPRLETDIRRLSWSECSRASLSTFLSRGDVECLREQTNDQMRSILDPTPTGTLYDVDHQCRLKFGKSDAAMCPLFKDSEDFCSILWCEVGKKCRTLGDPPAEGTICGPHKWCQLGACVGMDDHYNPKIHGQWGHWSEWGHCSRHCGAGFEVSTRVCNNPQPENGGKYCLGDHERKRVCLSGRPCHKGLMEDLDEQCMRGRRREGVVTPRRALRNPKNLCHIQCAEMNSKGSVDPPYSFIYAENGTPCGREMGSLDMCLDGKCSKIGCDLVLNSQSVLDSCGSCNGNGTQCRRFNGIHEDAPDAEISQGYEYVTTIPSHAKLIHLQERGISSNFVALIDTDNNFPILNWNYQVQWSGLYTFGAFSVNYTRTSLNATHHSEQFVSIYEEISSPIDVYLLRQADNPGLHWGYVLGFESDSLSLTPVLEWKMGPWGPCDRTCGRGNQASGPECFENNRSVSNDLCQSLNRPPVLLRACSVQPCPPSWWIGPWQDCVSLSCEMNKGSQYRSVLCVQGAEEALPDDACLSVTKPIDSQVCTLNCTEMRNDKTNNGNHQVQPNKKDPLESNIIFLPSFASSNSTNMTFQNEYSVTEDVGSSLSVGTSDQAMQDSRWVVGEWVGFCSCRSSLQIREVSCPPGMDCNTLKRPSTYKFCSQVSLCLTWITSAWTTDCDQQCGTMSQSRLVMCPIFSHTCDPKIRPLATRDCQLPACHFWSVGTWSQCSVSCGWGKKQRTVVCRHFLTQEEDENGCSNVPQPDTWKECISSSCGTDQYPQGSLNGDQGFPCEDELGSHICRRFQFLCKTNRYYQDKCCQTCG
eukprot:TCALIF_04161-PA protein Name:"Similar to Adamts7 A disintegrin and metalloproteinase with thrombospondin motifs 7 (Mus musculus)" AED:0.03 eAED:0.03 QI:0/0.8/0.5/0.83/0.8/0.66/6/23/989